MAIDGVDYGPNRNIVAEVREMLRKVEALPSGVSMTELTVRRRWRKNEDKTMTPVIYTRARVSGFIYMEREE